MILTVLAYVVGAVVLAGAGGVTYLYAAYPSVEPVRDVKVEITPTRIERGRYLANAVAQCVDCHSTRDWSLYSAPIKAGSEGMGGEKFGEEAGFPGNFYAPNLTPTALKDWSDGELIRAFTAGINKSGTALFPVMPYLNYGKMSEEDVASIVAYIRSLKPIENSVPASSANFPMNLILRTIPTNPRPSNPPKPTDGLEYGRYVITMASCNDCHTRQEKGQPIAGLEYAGGFEFKLPSGVVRSANITPDDETGIGKWSRDDFIGRFKAFESKASLKKIEAGEQNTIMPWNAYAQMTKEDLGAIYDYLRSVRPVNNRVEKFASPSH